MKKLITATLAIVLLFSASDLFAQKGKFQAVFIFNFYKQMEWPAKYKNTEFVIGILGKSEVKPMLEKLTTSRTSGGRTRFVIKQFNTPSQISKCQMLYIPSNQSAKFNEVTRKLRGTSTLVITEKAGLGGRGAGINFVKINRRLRFEMNRSSLRKAHIEVSQMLKTLAILI